MTPHNHAKPGDYAEAVLLPGDPLRAKWIAETFLDDGKLVNSVRNCLGYTGTWKGKRVSVQATGMGQPSLSIYVHELINTYGLKTLIRVGTCGGLNAKVKVRDLILAQAASTDSAIVRDRFGPYNFAPIADFGLLRAAAEKAEAAGMQNMLTRTPSDGYAGCCYALRDADLRADDAKITAPTLVIVGDQDAATSPAAAKELAAAIKGARLEIVADAAHIPTIEQPAAINRLLGDFLGAQRAAAAE